MCGDYNKYSKRELEKLTKKRCGGSVGRHKGCN
jgi:hypothetical protein